MRMRAPTRERGASPFDARMIAGGRHEGGLEQISFHEARPRGTSLDRAADAPAGFHPLRGRRVSKSEDDLHMVHFRSRADGAKARLPPAVKAVVLERIDAFEKEMAKLGAVWNPEDDGHFAYATADEADLPLADFGWDRRLRDLLPEAVHYHGEARLWEVIHIPGNSWGLTLFVPDSPALPREVREWLLANADEPDATLARKARP